jgi:hypothetical protein
MTTEHTPVPPAPQPAAPQPALRLDRREGRLVDAEGRQFDPASRTWGAGAARAPADLAGVDTVSAATWLQCETPFRVRVPVGVIGPRDAEPALCAAAEAVGEGLARMGVALLCGGRSGVMEAACRGAERAGGVAIGLLPDADPALANAHATLVLATGLGEARNAIIARASLCLVAVGDSFGTLSEVALGRQFGKTVIGLEGAARVSGVLHVGTPREALEQVARCLLGLAAGGHDRG